ncbi:MAG: preprotein translocase subunit SecG [Candidatus Niyogibacteria bacterium RIFCSPLOWO2_12_FULL_41_13]|uniref:Protein-export membrane protein SecG n=1 Tax=Candidatus Niyogibacteria bacterium RIFCSPLOWO2_12_FULL_41_13 TaxID=1801726 RepID=A0A1G2F4X3_9BACT|nr:MAG: preprotein translocase subunit SecG [Candidatus Niyogibacteria bacterium RIFCSPLOWO2_12_FULL_41_13]
MESVKSLFPYFQIGVSALLIAFILLQRRGSGLGEALGGGSEFYRSRRGIEKILFNGAIILGILFFILAFFTFIS